MKGPALQALSCAMQMTASPSTYPYNEDGSFSSNFPALNGANPIQTETYNYNRLP